jgi:hypothetical protein
MCGTELAIPTGAVSRYAGPMLREMTNNRSHSELVQRGQTRPRRRWRSLQVGALVVLLVAATHPWWLTGWARFLCADEAPLDAPANRSVTVVVFGGRDVAAYIRPYVESGRVELVLIISRSPGRLERRGIVRPSSECFRDALLADGLEPQHIEVQLSSVQRTSELLQTINQRLDAAPNEQAVLLCGEWQSRWLRGQRNAHVSAVNRSRCQVQAVSHPDEGVTNWWRTKDGLRRGVEATLQLALDWSVRDSIALPPRERTAADFIRAATADADAESDADARVRR